MSIDSNNAEYVGGVVGWTNSCTFTNCTGETQLTVRSGSGWSLGGFVGVSFTSSFVDCDLKTIVVATDFYCVGGFAGYLDYSSFADCDVSDASLSVSNCALTGGFAGQAEETNIASCTFDGQLIIVPGTDYPTGYVAGFVAYASAEIQNQYISNCTVHSGSSITLTDTPTQMHYVGGLIGYGRGSTNWKLFVNNNYVRISLIPSTPANTVSDPLIAGYEHGTVELDQNDAEWE